VFTPEKNSVDNTAEELAMTARPLGNVVELQNAGKYSKAPKIPPVLQKNIITKDTKIFGAITSESNIEIAGIVEGDVECKGNVLATGKITGKIICDSAEINNAVIEGDMNIVESLVIKAGSEINGKISGKTINIAGRIKGDVFSASEVKVCSEACITGNITASFLIIEKGAILHGKVDIQREEME
jgi:cytoskeletal protein CcmA (bactofilin family)